MTQTFGVKISLTPASVSMLQILAFPDTHPIHTLQRSQGVISIDTINI